MRFLVTVDEFVSRTTHYIIEADDASEARDLAFAGEGDEIGGNVYEVHERNVDSIAKLESESDDETVGWVVVPVVGVDYVPATPDEKPLDSVEYADATDAVQEALNISRLNGVIKAVIYTPQGFIHGWARDGTFRHG